MLPNSKLIFKNCRNKPYFDSYVYILLGFQPISPFSLSERSDSAGYQNTLSIKISSDCISYYIDCLKHSIHTVFAESLNLSQVMDSGTQIRTIIHYITENTLS